MSGGAGKNVLSGVSADIWLRQQLGWALLTAHRPPHPHIPSSLYPSIPQSLLTFINTTTDLSIHLPTPPLSAPKLSRLQYDQTIYFWGSFFFNDVREDGHNSISE